jgi:hypothetical protein
MIVVAVGPSCAFQAEPALQLVKKQAAHDSRRDRQRNSILYCARDNRTCTADASTDADVAAVHAELAAAYEARVKQLTAGNDNDAL